MDLVSVIVPVYNVEPYLVRCVNSVRNQTYRNLEIILVDDGSPDRCPQLCDQMQQEDSRIRVIHKKNGGQGLARNSALEVASGEYVTFIDADDWIAEDHIENLYKRAIEVNADAVIGGHTGIAPNGEKKINPARLGKRVYEKGEILEKIVVPLIGAEPCSRQDVEIESSSSMTLYRMAILKNYMLWYRSERVVIAEDLFFNIDFLCRAKCVAVIDEVGYYYFENHASTSWRYDAKRFDRTIKFYEELHSVIAQYGIEDMIGHRAERTFIMKVRLAIRNVVLSGLPMKSKLKEIKKILNEPILQQVLAHYPTYSMILVMRIMVAAMKSRNTIGVYLLMYFRESMRTHNRLWETMRDIGVRKKS